MKMRCKNIRIMKKYYSLFAFFSCALFLFGASSLKQSDPYQYLQSLEDPRTLPCIEKENSLTEAQLAPLLDLRLEIFQELKQGVVEEENHPDPYWEKIRAAIPRFSLVLISQSGDGRFVAFVYEKDPSLKQYLGLLDLNTETYFFDLAENILDSLGWTLDHQSLLYVQNDDTDRAFRICYLDLKQRVKQVLFEEKDVRFGLKLKRSCDKQLFFIESKSFSTSEIRTIRAESVKEPISLYLSRQEGIRYEIDTADQDHFYILANFDSSEYHFYLAPKNSEWKEIVVDHVLSDFLVFKNYVVLLERKNGLPILEILDRQTGARDLLQFEEPSYTFEIKDPEYHSERFLIQYSSLKTAPTLYEYDMSSKSMKISQEPSDYVTERLFAEAQDGTLIPISLLRKKDIDLNRPSPLLLCGYGGYGDTRFPYFRKEYLALANRGVIVAIAHPRGGGEYGWSWYEQGRLLQKKNTFSDFIDTALHLIKIGYTTPSQLAIWGRSAGGLLVGYVINERPDLFKAVVAEAPFVDVLNTMLNPKLPWTTQEYEEWGNPEHIEFYDYIRSYCPYTNVRKQPYPALFLTGGVYDRLVRYWEPLKLTAKLREYKLDTNPLLLHIDFEGGHFGSGDTEKDLWLTSAKFAFLLDQIKQPL